MATTRPKTTRSKTTRTRAAKPTTLKSIDPRTGRVVAEVGGNAAGDVADIVATARKVFAEWSAIPPAGRVRMLRSVRQRLYERLDDLVETISEENGKPRVEALAHDVVPALMTLLYYERNTARTLRSDRILPIPGPVVPKLLAGFNSRIDYRPFGVVGCITPWNYPFNLALAAVAPALFAGNTVVIKPSEVTPRVGELLRDILEPLPSGVATVIQGGGDVGAALVDVPCDKICFIGSPATGKKIAAAAAEHLTPVVMELGGQDAAIVCDDADLEIATSGVLWGAFFNAGQSCVSMERAYVVDSVADEFTDKLLAKLRDVRQDDDAEIGPLTFAKQLETVQRHVADAVDKGAEVLAGGPDAGRRNENGSLWFAPTVLTNVTDEMEVTSEETFGPVLPILRVRDEEEAIRRTNEEGVSLAASVWTRDARRGERIARRLRAGSVTVNEAHVTEGMPWTPWGGVGGSGYGRVHGIWGLREFTYPVHIARKTMPGMKSLWWYPYDDATTRSWYAVARFLGSRSVADKVTAVRDLASNATRAIKNKL